MPGLTGRRAITPLRGALGARASGSLAIRGLANDGRSEVVSAPITGRSGLALARKGLVTSPSRSGMACDGHATPRPTPSTTGSRRA